MKNKKVLFISIVAIILVLILAIFLTPNLIKRLKANIFSTSSNQKEVINDNAVDQICGAEINNENFITVNGNVVINKGNEGVATINIKSDNLVFTKEIKVKSNEFSSFNYVLPRGNYTLTITKDGYKTYQEQISESKDLTITLVSNDMGNLLFSSRTFLNTYYEYYQDGTLHLKAIGSPYDYFSEDKMIDENFFYSALTDVLVKSITSKGFLIEYFNSAKENDLVFQFVSLVFPGFIQDAETKNRLIEISNKIKNNECNNENYLTDESCILFDSTDIKDDNYSFEVYKNVLDIIINIPQQTKLIIDDDVVVLPFLSFVSADEVIVNKNILFLNDYTFMSSKIKTMTINTPLFGDYGSYFASASKINNLIIGEGITNIPSNAFSGSEIDNVRLPSTLEEIGTSSFEDAKLNGIVLPDSVKYIRDNAFSNLGITDIKLPNSLIEIGRYAFSDNKLTKITIPERVEKIWDYAFYNNAIKEVEIKGNRTRFNNDWSHIGFPENLKPSE